MAAQSPMNSFPRHHVHNCIFSIDSLMYVFETGPFYESFYGSQQVHKCIETPQHQNKTFQVTIVWCINDNFSSLPIQGLVKSYNGGKIVLLLQIKSNLDTVHDLSPEWKLIIDKNLTDDCPECWLPWCNICIIPCQFGVASLKPRETSHRISILLSLSRNLGRSSKTTSWQACFANLYSKKGIVVLFSVSSSEICLRGIRWFVCFPGVTAAMTHIPWNVPLPSIVMMLWSTLSAAKKTDISSKSTSPPRTSGSTQSAAFFSNLITSVYDEQNFYEEYPQCSSNDTDVGFAQQVIFVVLRWQLVGELPE